VTNIFPVLRYRETHEAIDFLCRAFGFERLMVYEDEGGRVEHAELALGAGVVMVGTASSSGTGKRGSVDPKEAELGPYVYVENVEAHHERAQAAGAQIAYGPRDTDYESREYAALDTEGLLWSFGTYLPERRG